MCGMQVRRGQDEYSLNGGDRERLLAKLFFLKTLTEGAVATEAGSLFQYYSKPSPKMLTISFGGGVPCSGALLDHVEWEGGKTTSEQYSKDPR